MSDPISVDLPHRLGAAEARRRIQNGIGRLEDHIPGGANVDSHWTGDSLNLRVAAMGQEVSARIDIRETLVHLEVKLPPILAFFGKQVEALIRRQGTELLEDKSGKKGG